MQKYPFPFCLEIGYRIQGKQIEVIWKVKNTGDKEMHFQIGAHPAFYWPEFDANSLERGFFGFDRKDGLKYILISEKGCADPSVEYSLEMTDGLLPLDTHTFDKDALILENEQVRKVTLYNKEKRAYLSLHFNAPVVGLWSPPAKNAPLSASSLGMDVATVHTILVNIKIRTGCNICNQVRYSKEDTRLKLMSNQ